MDARLLMERRFSGRDKRGKKIDDSFKLFMVAGVHHCRGGDGTDTFDMLSALSQWVEQGKAPERIVASKMTDGKVERTRPLCPYPQVATYKEQAARTMLRTSFVRRS